MDVLNKNPIGSIFQIPKGYLKSNIIFTSDKEYIPFIFFGQSYNYSKRFDKNQFAKIVLDKYKKFTSSELDGYILSALTRIYQVGDIKTKTNANKVIDLLHKNLIKQVQDKNYYHLSGMNPGTTQSYTGLIKQFTEELSGTYGWRFRNLVAYRNMIYLDKYIDGVPHFNPLITLCVKRDYVEYVRKCLFLGETPLPQAFSVIVSSDLLHEKDLEVVKRHYIKSIKPLYEKSGITDFVELRDTKQALCSYIKKPNLKTIKDKKEWLKNVSDEFLSFEETIQKLNSKNSIDLVLC